MLCISQLAYKLSMLNILLIWKYNVYVNGLLAAES